MRYMLNEAGRFSNAMKGFKHTSDELNQMDMDNQAYKANQGKGSQMKNAVHSMGSDFYDAFDGFRNIFIDNIFWGDADKGCIEKLKGLQRQIDSMYDKLSKIYPYQIKEDLSGAWWGFKNKDKDIESLENEKERTDRHFDSIDTTNEEIEKATRLVDIMCRLLDDFMNLFSSCGSEHTRERNDYKHAIEKCQDFYDELHKYQDRLKSMKDEVGEKYWTRDNGEQNESRVRTHKVYMTEAQLRACLNRAIKRGYWTLKR